MDSAALYRVKCRRMLERLSRVRGAFYGSFYKPRQIQFDAIEPIMQGRNVVLSSCTASGKTEAYLAPLTERWLEPMRAGKLCLLIVCPTRALANDLVKRISVPLSRCSISVLLRTGDHPNPLKDKKVGVLVTTLESLDSLLCRWAVQLLDVKAVVFEELHVAEGTARGDQLSVLAERLDVLLHCAKATQIAGTLGNLGLSLQRLAVTATPGNAEVINQKYLAGQAVVVENKQGVNFEVDYCRPYDEDTISSTDAKQARAIAFLRSCIKYCRQNDCQKMLVFVKSRAEAELLASSKGYISDNPFGNAVFSHHSSLGTEQREKVEKNFAAYQKAICFATSTLEVGIDIGDVDAVALTAPPMDVNAFLQRVGRSGRRGQTPKVLCLYETNFEKAQYEHLVGAAQVGTLFSDHPPFLSSVLIQQSASLVCQSAADMISKSSLHNRLPAYLRQVYTEDVCEKILQGAMHNDLLKVRRQGGYSRSEKLKEAFEKGEIHHNISRTVAGRGKISVIDKASNRIIGTLSGNSTLLVGDFFYFSGTSYRVISGPKDGKIMACPDRNVDHSKLRRCDFEASGLPKVSEIWTADFAKFLAIPTDCSCYTLYGADLLVCSHFMGTVGGVFLKVFLDCLGYSDSKANAYVIMCSSLEEVKALAMSSGALQMIIRQNIESLAQKLDLGPWSSCLPDELLEKEVLKVAEHIHLFEHMRQFDNFIPAEATQSVWLCGAAEISAS